MPGYAGRIFQILNDLERAFRGTATFDTKTTFETKNATYGEAFLKVGYQLGTALLASKELLLVVADFPDVQTRNVTVAKTRLSQAADRLQNGVVIIAHRDAEGDGRLREWGREVGLTVLPLDYSEEVPVGEKLLHQLLKDLYSYDRFDLTGPVRSEYQFFGRPFIPDLARRLAEGTIHALFGMRKIGKTSLLNRVLDELLERHGCRCVMIDASDDSIWSLDAAGLLAAIRGGVEAASANSNHYASVVSEGLSDFSSVADEGARLLAEIQASDQPLVLLIDEVDYITPSSPGAKHWEAEFNPLFRAIRRAYQETTRTGPVFSIVLSGVSSRWFMEESVNGVENAALALVPEGYLPPLERAESITMIETLGRACGILFEGRSADIIAHTASDNPFWIRKAGSYINSCFSRERPIRVYQKDVETLCAEFLEVEGNQLAYSSLRHLFRIFPDLGFAAISATRGTETRQNLLSSLGRYGILGSSTDPSGPMMAEGLKRWSDEDGHEVRKLPLDPERLPASAQIEAGSTSPAAEEEWAEMLSEVSHFRNIAERRLRELVLVVIRSECTSKDQRRPADVIRAALPVDRRQELEELGASQLLKRLYWLDLLQIIRKNWRWFEQIFGDRAKFDMWGEIVNDRPDTHAKDIDGAELALQRRAIDWFAAAINNSKLL